MTLSGYITLNPIYLKDEFLNLVKLLFPLEFREKDGGVWVFLGLWN
jgi:hypothetical protein